MSVKKVLVIATSFPPLGGRNCERVIKFTKFLPEFGWEPFVLTISKKGIPIFDYSIEDELSENLPIYRMPSPDISTLLSKISSRIESKYEKEKKEFLILGEGSQIEKFLLWIKMLFSRRIPGVLINFINKYVLIPDGRILWVPLAILKGVWLCFNRRIDIIYSTAPSFSSHLAAMWIKIFTRRKWIADYRDLWTRNPNYPYQKTTRKRIEYILDRAVMRSADCILTVSPEWRDFLLKEFSVNSNVGYITNGYDFSDFERISNGGDGKFNISHTGVIIDSYPVEKLLMAVAELERKYPYLKQELRINLVGYIAPDKKRRILEVIDNYGLQDTTRITGQVMRREALRWQKNSSLLVLMYAGYGENIKGMIPSKVFDYIAAKRPVLGILPDCKAKEIIEKGKCGTVVKDDTSEISDAILHMYHNYKKGDLNYHPDWNYLERYDRRNLTAQLAQVLNNNLCNHPTNHCNSPTNHRNHPQKKVLIIATDFPPRISPGAIRVLKFAKYLPDFGWKPVILTPQDEYNPWGKDYRLIREIPHGTRVYSIFHPDLVEIIVSFFRKRNRKSCLPSWETSQEEKRNIPLFKGVISKILKGYKNFTSKFIFIPDPFIIWIPWTYLRALSIIRKEKIEAILTTAPSYSTFILGYFLKRITSKSWIADYRDLWTGDHSRMWIGKRRRKFEERIENLILTKADAIVTVSRPKLDYLSQRINLEKENFHLIYNGYDPSDFPSPSEAYREKGMMTITFTGRLYKKMTSIPFLEALGELFMEKNYLREKIKVYFVGEIATDERRRMDEVIKRYNFENNIEFKGYTPYDEVLKYQTSADVLLLIVGIAENCDGIIPTKLFEYFGAGKPILGIVPEGEAHELIVRSRAGMVAEPRDKEGIKSAILSLFEKYKINELTIEVDKETSRKFERKELTKELATVLDTISQNN